MHVHVVFQLHVHIHHSLSCVPLRQYRACVVDSLGLGITCLISLYYVYKASQSCLLCHPYIPHSNLKNFYIYLYMYTDCQCGSSSIIVLYCSLSVSCHTRTSRWRTCNRMQKTGWKRHTISRPYLHTCIYITMQEFVTRSNTQKQEQQWTYPIFPF